MKGLSREAQVHQLNHAAARHLKTLHERGVEDLATPALDVIALLHRGVDYLAKQGRAWEEIGDLERQISDMFHWNPDLVMQYLEVSPEGNETFLLESLEAAETPEDAGFEIVEVVRCNLMSDPCNDQYPDRYL